MPNQTEKKERKNGPVTSSHKAHTKPKVTNQPRISSAGHDSKQDKKSGSGNAEQAQPEKVEKKKWRGKEEEEKSREEDC